MRALAFLAAALLGGCGSIEGQVRDGGTKLPVVGAIVRVSTIGWGRRDGQLVWDAETVHEARTDQNGRFIFKGIDGGGRLQVQSAAGRFDHGVLCPRSPMLVWVGGPNSAVRTDRPLIIGGEKARASFDDRRAMSTEQLGIRLSGGEPDKALGTLRSESAGGVAFIEGTGSVPEWPARSAFRTSAEMDMGRQCGWFFVYTPLGRGVIDARHPGWTQNPGEDGFGVTLFALLEPVAGN